MVIFILQKMCMLLLLGHLAWCCYLWPFGDSLWANHLLRLSPGVSPPGQGGGQCVQGQEWNQAHLTDRVAGAE